MNEQLMQRVIEGALSLGRERGVTLSQYQLQAIWRSVRTWHLDEGMAEEEAIESALDLHAGRPAPSPYSQ